jgi:phospholipid transport system transporter-binding protein
VSVDLVNRSDTAAFSVAADGARWAVSGTLTFDNAASVYAASSALALPTSGIVACDGLGHVDSSAVAVLLGLKRRAVQEGRTLRFESVPAPLHALAVVYGVDRVLDD